MGPFQDALEMINDVLRRSSLINLNSSANVTGGSPQRLVKINNFDYYTGYFHSLFFFFFFLSKARQGTKIYLRLFLSRRMNFF